MSSCKLIGKSFLVVSVYVVLNIFCMSSMRGTVSKALLISIMARSVLYANFGTFRPSCMYCVSVVRSAVVECRALKPCCVGDRGMCGVIVLRIGLSRTLMGLHNKEIGLHDEGSVGILLGLSVGKILLFSRCVEYCCGLMNC